jgi:hypothetical protein
MFSALPAISIQLFLACDRMTLDDLLVATKFVVEAGLSRV